MTRRRLWLSLAIAAIFVYRAGLAYYALWGPSARPISSLNAGILEFAVQLWVPLLCLAAAAFVGLLRPHDAHALRAMFMFAAFALVFGPDADLLPAGWRTAAVLTRSGAGVVALPLAVLLFFLGYPTRSAIDRRLPWLKWLLPSVGVALLAFLMLPDLGASGLAGWLGHARMAPAANLVLFFWIGAHYPVAMTALGMSLGRAQTPDERRRLMLLFAGTCAGTLPLLLIVVVQSIVRVELHPGVLGLLVLTIGLFPLSFVYVVVKHRVFGIRLILRRGLQYALVSRGFPVVGGLVIFALLYPLAEYAARRLAPKAAQTAPLLSAVLTLGLVGLNRKVAPAIDRRFFRDAYDARLLLMELSRAVRRLASRPAELLDTVKRQIQESLHPRFVTLQLNDPRWVTLAPDYDTPLVSQEGGGRHLLVAGAAIQAATMVARVAVQAGDSEPRPVSFRVPGPPDDQGGEGLLVPIAGGGGVLGFLVLGEKLSEEPYSGEDMELLQTVAEQTAGALENAQLFQQVAEQERLRREVEIAREVQGQLFPKVFPPLATLRYCGSCRPARAVGGDYYDFIALGQSRLGVALGDIAGKGISAALLMTSLHAMLRSHALLGSDDLATLVADINRLLYEATDAARYATFFYGVYDADSRSLRYVNAGHIPPILVRPEDESGTFHRLCEGGPVIGLLPDPSYEPGSVALRPGDVLVIVSDGVSEAENPEGDMYGEERVAHLVAEHLHESESEIHEHLVEAVTRFRAGAPQGDDMTLVVAKVT